MPTNAGGVTDVYVVGTGMVGYRQVTREVDAALRAATRIFAAHPQDLVLDHLREEYGAAVVDVTGEYEADAERDAIYERIAERVLDAAETDAPVALAVYGHPTVFVSPSKYVRERAPDRGLSVEVRPGVSSMDCIYAEFGIDPAANGVQMFEATDLLLREFDLDPAVPAVLWQVGTVETVLYSTGDSAPQRFTRLREYLQRYYPDDHEVALVRVATYPVTESEWLSFPLSEFEAMHDRVKRMHTLYVPPAERRPVQNETLAEQVDSRAHLDRITRGDDDGG